MMRKWIGDQVRIYRLILRATWKTRKSASRDSRRCPVAARMFIEITAGGKGGKPGQWAARKAQMVAKRYKAAGGGYKN